MLQQVHELTCECLDVLTSLSGAIHIAAETIGESAAKDIVTFLELWQGLAPIPLFEYEPWRAKHHVPLERCGLRERSAHELARAVIARCAIALGRALFGPEPWPVSLGYAPPVPDNDPAELADLPAELFRSVFPEMPDLDWIRLALDAEHATPTAAELPAVASGNEDRDAWIYAKVTAGIPYKEILSELRKRSDWEPLETIEGVRRAARRHAERHGLKRPPSRHPGRPTKDRKYQQGG